MQTSLRRECLLGILCVIGLVVTVAWAQTAPPPAPAKGKLERLRIAVAPLGWDTNFAQFIAATRGRKVDCLASYTDQTCCAISSILRRCAGR
jgi:hypothetical protein